MNTKMYMNMYMYSTCSSNVSKFIIMFMFMCTPCRWTWQVVYTSEENKLKNGQKGQSCEWPPQFNSTESGITLQPLSDNSPGPPHLTLLDQQRHPGHDGAEDIIICKGQDPLHRGFYIQLAPDGAEGDFSPQELNWRYIFKFFFYPNTGSKMLKMYFSVKGSTI